MSDLGALAAALEREFGEAVALDGGFAHGPEPAYWRARAEAIMPVVGPDPGLASAPEGSTLTFTRMSVAFPSLPIDSRDRSVYDRVNVSLAARGGGTHGEFSWEFYDWDRRNKAVQIACFGDGLVCLFDERVQRVVEAWRAMSNPDEMTPDDLIELLRNAGAVPGRYMKDALT